MSLYPKSTVVHLIPFHGVGGVERAATSVDGYVDSALTFSVIPIIPSGVLAATLRLWNPFHYYRSIRQLIRLRPTILVVSLWRAYAAGIILKLLRPQTQLVVFLHLPTHVHLLDAVLTHIASRLSTQVWADCSQTLETRLPTLEPSHTRVISFVTEKVSTPHFEPSTIEPRFVFWGRIHPQKCLTRAIRLFASIRAIRPNATFVIIGPDGGDLSAILSLVRKYHLYESVSFLGPLDFPSICHAARDCTFYLQLSSNEGMAMSVVEAMQLGLVPIVTPVGEIKNYCHHFANSVLVDDDASAVEDIIYLLSNSSLYASLRRSAISRWSSTSLYKDDIISTCHELLQSRNSRTR